MDRKIIIGFVLLLCIVAIIVGIVETVNNKRETKDNLIGTVTEENEVNSIDNLTYDEILTKFNGIFDNNIDSQGINIVGINKIDESKSNYVYTASHYKGEVTDKYIIDVRVPNININNDKVNEINKEIDDFYLNRVNYITKRSSKNLIYDVSYKAYINYNILSLVIKETLKPNETGQQVSIKTYNYNINTKSLVSFNDIINKKEISEDDVKNKIKETLEKVNKKVDGLNALGANVEHRDINNEIYNIENIKSCFLGENKTLYIIYTYNTENVSDYDVIAVK